MCHRAGVRPCLSAIPSLIRSASTSSPTALQGCADHTSAVLALSRPQNDFYAILVAFDATKQPSPLVRRQQGHYGDSHMRRSFIDRKSPFCCLYAPLTSPQAPRESNPQASTYNHNFTQQSRLFDQRPILKRRRGRPFLLVAFALEMVFLAGEGGR